MGGRTVFKVACKEIGGEDVYWIILAQGRVHIGFTDGLLCTW